ncbi:MAG: esterase family protein [Clostridium sp.]|nr:esterase family protein [Clostridium sp.]
MKKASLIAAIIAAGITAQISLSSSTPAGPAPAVPGRVDTMTVNSALVRSPYTFNVALPSQYLVEGDTASYPVIYLLNGHGGNQNNWGRLVPLDSLASVYSVIFVSPDGRNSWYWDSPLRPDLQMESFIIDELVPFVDERYRTIAAPESRAITGLSMGGHGAMWLALRHQDIFGNVGSTSGGVDIVPFPGRWNIDDAIGTQAQNPGAWRSHSVMSQLDSLDRQPLTLNIIFDCGTEDFFFTVNNTLDSILTARRVPHTYITGPGAHNGQYWEKSIIPQLEFFNRHLAR